MYEVTKSAGEERYAFAPLYSPNMLDAHGEMVDPATLQRALWRFMDTSDRKLNLQHRRGMTAGRIVEAVAWPEEHTATLTVPDGVSKSRTVTLPAGTVYIGTIFEPWAWELVKAGKLQGLSMGGSAKRISGASADFEEEAVSKALGDGVADELDEELDGIEPRYQTINELTKSYNDQAHSFTPGPAMRCLYCSHQESWHLEKAAAMTNAPFAPAYQHPAYQPPLTINDAAGLIQAVESLPKLKDQQTAMQQIRAAAQRLGLTELLQAHLNAKHAKHVAGQHEAHVASLVAQHSAAGAEASLTALSTPQTPQKPPPRSGYVRTGRGGRGPKLKPRPGGPTESYPKPGISPGGSPSSIDHSSSGAAGNAGGGHGERITGHQAGSDPRHLAKNAGPADIYAPRNLSLLPSNAESPLTKGHSSSMPNDENAIRDLSALATDPASRELITKMAPTRQQLAKQLAWEPEEDYPVRAQVIDMAGVDQATYDEYRRTGDLRVVIAKAADHAAYGEVTAADVGEVWLQASRDPRQMAAANEEYERQRAEGWSYDDRDGA